MVQNCNRGPDVNSHCARAHTHPHPHTPAGLHVCASICVFQLCLLKGPHHPRTGDTGGLQTSVSRHSSPLKGTHAFWPLSRAGAEKGQDEPGPSMLGSRLCSEHEGTYPRTQASLGDIPLDPGLLRGLPWDLGLLRGHTSWT